MKSKKGTATSCILSGTFGTQPYNALNVTTHHIDELNWDNESINTITKGYKEQGGVNTCR